MRKARGMAALGAAAVVMTAALLGCKGGDAAKQQDANASAETTPPAQDHDNPAQPTNPESQPAQAADQYDPATAAGAVKGVPAPTNTAPIEAVANYFAELPGFDLAPLGEKGRAKFLHRVNSELCTCGCKNDTLAFCLVNDPKCPQVKGQVQAVYDEVKSGQ
jgi:hypothetical protein